jgi:predicted RNase H-related nuclease YkuK (DUF458 family)
MEYIFKLDSGNSVDLITHCNEILSKHQTDIYVGTDSINSKNSTIYCIVVAFRSNKSGVHFIYKKINIQKIRDKFNRLWKEVELSITVAEYLRKHNINVDTIELDLNSDKKWGSHGVVGAGVGYCSGLGYKTNIKPDEQMSTRAADHILTH